VGARHTRIRSAKLPPVRAQGIEGARSGRGQKKKKSKTGIFLFGGVTSPNKINAIFGIVYFGGRDRFAPLQSLAHEPADATQNDRRGSAPPLACIFVKPGQAVLLG
jgi:hypothetical protein